MLKEEKIRSAIIIHESRFHQTTDMDIKNLKIGELWAEADIIVRKKPDREERYNRCIYPYWLIYTCLEKEAHYCVRQ